jgi:hypothetical protein
MVEFVGLLFIFKYYIYFKFIYFLGSAEVIPGSPMSAVDTSQGLKDLQQSFEKYREEQAKNTQMLVADIDVIYNLLAFLIIFSEIPG